MVRFILLAIALMVAVPSFAQDRIFRATPIDLEQDERLDTLESRYSELAKSIDNLAASINARAQTVVSQPMVSEPIPDPVPDTPVVLVQFGDVKMINGTLHYLGVNGSNEVRWLPVVQQSQPAYQVERSQEPAKQTASARYTTSELRSFTQRLPHGTFDRFGKYRGLYANVFPESYVWNHLKEPEHGFTGEQVNGLTEREALILHDLRHGGKVSPWRSGPVQMVQSQVSKEPAIFEPAKPLPQPVRKVVQTVGNGCPGGRCPSQRRNQGW